MRAAVLLLFLLSLGASRVDAVPRAAAPGRIARATVEDRLRKYQPDPAAWRALGAGVDERLMEIVADGKVEVLLRARALSTLAYFPGAAARKVLETTVEGKAGSSDAGDRLLVRKAAVSLGWLGGARVPGILAPLLDSPDAEVRLDAAIALGLTRLPAAAETLRQRLELEPVPQVKAQISRQIQLIDETRVTQPPPKR